MKANTGFSDEVVKQKTNKSNLGLTLGLFLVGLVLGGMVVFSLIPANPLQQYITERTCNFISMGDFQTAVCTDGTAWKVSPFQQ